VRIGAPRERVFEELVAPRRQLGLQPLLVEVNELPPAPETSGTRRFEAVERIVLLGPLALRNRITVEVSPGEPPSRVDFHATSRGGVEVWSEFRLEALPGATEVREHVRVRCPGWLRPFVGRQARRAQERLLANLKARLEPLAKNQLSY
jgi:hypothetical protein